MPSHENRLFLNHTLNRAAVILFRLKVFNQRLLRLRPTSIELDIRDFHSYFIILFLKEYFLIPDTALVVERLPSTQVPHGLRDTLGYFAA